MSDQHTCSCHLGSQIENIKVNVYNPRNNIIEEKNILDRTHDWTVLFFYPADFSVVCPTELHALNEYKEARETYNTKVYVISRDSVYTHKQRVESDEMLKGFSIDMISDRDGDLGKYLNLIDEQSKDYQRATIIVDRLGRIQSLDLMPGKVGRNITELLRIIKAMTYVINNPNCLCPESREETEHTLRDTIQHEETNKKLFSNT